jgi:hypothetical protein
MTWYPVPDGSPLVDDQVMACFQSSNSIPVLTPGSLRDLTGGPREYMMFTDSVLSPNGYTALAIYARYSDVRHGCFEILKSPSNKINLGVK